MRVPPERIASGLFAVVLPVIPILETTLLVHLDFDPRGPDAGFLLSFPAWAFLHTALLAFGTLRIRPRPGREAVHARFVVPVLVQAAAWLLLWTLRAPMALSGAGLPSGAVVLLLPFLVWCLFAAPVAALFHARSSLRSGALVAGQFIPVAWALVMLASGAAFHV